MKEITTKNGARLKLAIPSFENTMGLKDSIEKALLKNGVKVPNLNKVENLLDLNITPELVEVIAQNILSIDSDPEVNRFIFLCLERSTFEGERISKEIFDDEKLMTLARGAYYEIKMACIKEALAPFFVPLFSKLSSLGKTVLQNQKAPSEPAA